MVTTGVCKQSTDVVIQCYLSGACNPSCPARVIGEYEAACTRSSKGCRDVHDELRCYRRYVTSLYYTHVWFTSKIETKGRDLVISDWRDEC